MLLGAGLAGCTGEGLGSGTGSGAGSDGAPKGSALKALDDLAVKGRAPKTGYARDEFGAAWADTDHNGCGTRDDILRRDLTGTSFRADRGGDCVVVSGTLADPYTGRRIDFTRGRSTVDIDHVVALSDAWQKGAKYWSRDKRRQIANDPLNLLAVDGPTNRGKGDGDAATWLPPDKAFRCPYVARQVAVKKKYGLWVTEAEKAAMAKVLDTCPDQPCRTPASRPRPAAARVPAAEAATGTGMGTARRAPHPRPMPRTRTAPRSARPAPPRCAAAIPVTRVRWTATETVSPATPEVPRIVCAVCCAECWISRRLAQYPRSLHHCQVVHRRSIPCREAKMLRRRTALSVTAAAAVLLAAPLLTSCGTPHAGAAAVVGGEQITVEAVQAKVAAVRAAQEKTPQAAQLIEASSDLQRNVVHRLVQNEVIERAADDIGVSVTRRELQAARGPASSRPAAGRPWRPSCCRPTRWCPPTSTRASAPTC